jgi:uncharacterized membrane protein HdeD (DUF308 family)
MRAAVMGPPADGLVLSAMIANWKLMAVRGGVAILFGLSILGWPSITLSSLVLLFGLYAVLDGVLALAATGRGRLRVLDAWPVALEGAVSVGIGIVALVAPLRVPRDLVIALALWGVVTGGLELLQAASLPRTGAGYWLLAAGGVSSISLALLLFVLPYGDARGIVSFIGAYALLFGVFVALGARLVSRARRAR